MVMEGSIENRLNGQSNLQSIELSITLSTEHSIELLIKHSTERTTQRANERFIEKKNRFLKLWNFTFDL